MTVSQVDPLQSPELVEIYRLNLFPYDFSSLFFCNSGTVTYNGVVYTGYPFKSSGFDKLTDGKLPTPSLTLSNHNGYITNLLALYNDLINCQIVRHFVYRDNLDDGTSPNPVNYSTGDIFYVNYYSADENTVTLFLRSVLEIGELQLPRNRISDLLV